MLLNLLPVKKMNITGKEDHFLNSAFSQFKTFGIACISYQYTLINNFTTLNTF